MDASALAAWNCINRCDNFPDFDSNHKQSPPNQNEKDRDVHSIQAKNY